MRGRDTGVSLIEMLVVLALFGLLALAVVVTLPGRGGASDDIRAAAFAADLTRAVDLALSRSRGFGVRLSGDPVFVERDRGRWVPHTDAHLAQVKLSGGAVRTLSQADVFAVSKALVPTDGGPLRVAFGGVVVEFDGAVARLTEE